MTIGAFLPLFIEGERERKEADDDYDRDRKRRRQKERDRQIEEQRASQPDYIPLDER